MSDREDDSELLPEISSSSSAVNRKSFAEVSQYLVKKYLLQPYPNPPTQLISEKIPRYYHGGLHASCAVYAIDLVIALIKKHFPNHERILKEYNDDPELQELFRYGVFCHDIANTAELDNNQEAHAEIFTKEMLALGYYNPDKIEIIAKAMRGKDATDNKNIFQMILHDVDVFEFDRTLFQSSHFDKNKLDIVKLSNNWLEDSPLQKSFEAELKEISHYYFIMSKILNRSIRLHEHCELAENCFLATGRILKALRIWAGFQPQLTEHGLCNTPLLEFFEDASEIDIPVLELYNRNRNATYIPALEKLFTLGEAKEDEDFVLKQYQDNYLYIRRLVHTQNKPYPIEEELSVIKNNAEILKKSGISTSEALHEAINQKKLSHFFVRPATCVRKGWEIRCFDENASGVLLNPSSNVLASHFFKENVESNLINQPSYSFSRPQGIKSLPCVGALLNKLNERETRRRGQMLDNYNRHTGKLFTARNEVWLTYNLDAVVGVLTGRSISAHRDAIMLRFIIYKKTGKLLSFYRYTPYFGLERVSEADVLIHAGLKNGTPSQKQPLVELEKRNILWDGKEYKSILGFEDITSSLSNTPTPTLTSPISYSMTAILPNKTNPAEKDRIPARAYFIDNFPVIELQQNNEAKKIFLDKTQKFAWIVKSHQQGLINDCNHLFEKLAWNIKKAYGITHPELGLYQGKVKGVFTWDKAILRLWYQKTGLSYPQQDVQALGYPHALKVSDIERERYLTPGVASVHLVLRKNQALDSMYNYLKSLEVQLTQFLNSQNHLYFQSGLEAKLLPENRYELLMMEICFGRQDAVIEKLKNLVFYLNPTHQETQYNELVSSLTDRNYSLPTIGEVICNNSNIKLSEEVLFTFLADCIDSGHHQIAENILNSLGITSKSVQLGLLIFALFEHEMDSCVLDLLSLLFTLFC